MTEVNATKAIIKETVKKGILAFAKKQLTKKPKFQILDLIIPKERKIRSIVGGLETSLGTTLWEPLAKALAKQNGFAIKQDKLETPANMPASLSSVLQMIIEDRKRNRGTFDGSSSHREIKRICQEFIKRPISGFEAAPKGRGVDIWLVKDGINYFFDTKTVQPNLSALTGCMEQVLSWYAFFYSRFPEENAEGRIIFPYNPHKGDFWEKVMGRGFPLEQTTEAWVEGEFWDFCSGLENTYDVIKSVFHDLRVSQEIEEDLRRLLD